MAGLIDLITFRPKRAIGSISAYVTIEEQHTDELTITQHPVEQGAAITDHAYKNPAQLVIRAGWSNASLPSLGDAVLAALGGDIGALARPSYAQEVYEKLLKLQSARAPFDIYTGKRRYKNMLMRSLATTTDQKTENVLIVTAAFQEVILVQTQATTLPDPSAQADPSKTAAVQNAGVKQLTPSPQADTTAAGIMAGDGG
jgi:hypothetical protein